MRERTALALCSAVTLLALISPVHAENESILYRFLGSPLLALAAIAVIVIIAFIYRKIKK